MPVSGELCGGRVDRDAGDFLYRAGSGSCRGGLTRAPGTGPWFGCGLSVGAAILLRPDGGLLLVAIEVYLLVLLVRDWGKSMRTGPPAPHRPPRHTWFGPA